MHLHELSRATDDHHLGSKVPKGPARTGPGAPTGCSRRFPCGGQVALQWEHGLAAGRERGVRKITGPRGPVSLLHLVLTRN